jgi:hypothetical protein
VQNTEYGTSRQDPTAAEQQMNGEKRPRPFSLDLGGLVDGLVESAQGKYGILTGWKSFPTQEYQSSEQCITYLKTLLIDVASAYNIVKDTYLQNQLDEVTALINSTLYKLRFLK